MRRSLHWKRPLPGVGVDFGCRGVKVVALAGEGGDVSLLAAGSETLAAGSVQDGAVRDIDEVGKALGRLLRRLEVRCRLLGLAIGGSSVLIKRFPAPDRGMGSGDSDGDAFRTAVAREAARHVPFHLESLEFDYEGPISAQSRTGSPIGVEADPGVVIFGAAPRETIDAHCRAVGVAGCEATRIELEPLALYAAAGLENALSAGFPQSDPLAIVEIGASRASIQVFRHGPGTIAAPSAPAGASGPGVAGRVPADLLVSAVAPGMGPAEAAPGPDARLRVGRAAEAAGDTAAARWSGSDASAASGFANGIGATLRAAVQEAGVPAPLRLRVSGGAAELPQIRRQLGELALGDPVTLDPLGRLGFRESGASFAVAAGLAYQQLLDRSDSAAGRG